MDFYNLLIVFLSLVHIAAFGMSACLLSLERKYCSTCKWWSDVFAIFIVLFNMIPIVGIFSSIGICFDCSKNIIKRLESE